MQGMLKFLLNTRKIFGFYMNIDHMEWFHTSFYELSTQITCPPRRSGFLGCMFAIQFIFFPYLIVNRDSNILMTPHKTLYDVHFCSILSVLFFSQFYYFVLFTLSGITSPCSLCVAIAANCHTMPSCTIEVESNCSHIYLLDLMNNMKVRIC